MKEVWLGTYMTVSPSLGRFSTPYTLGLHRVIWCAKCAVRVRPYKQTRSHERTEETKSNREVIIGHGGKKIARRELRVEVEVEWVGSLGGWVEGSEVWVGGVYVVVVLLLVTCSAMFAHTCTIQSHILRREPLPVKSANVAVINMKGNTKTATENTHNAYNTPQPLRIFPLMVKCGP